MSLPTPYYRDDAVTIYHADCRDVLPLLGKFNLLLTDPPYGIGEVTGTVAKQRAHKHEYLSFDDTPENVIKSVIPPIETSLLMCQRAIITPGPKVFRHYPQSTAFGGLYSPATTSLNTWGRAHIQPILFYGRPPRIGVEIGDTGIVVTSPDCDGADGHPCPKPLGVWKRLLCLGTNEGDTVLDPFAGSGTTGRAAKDLGRKAVLIEVEEAYCEIAARRMAQEVFQFS